LERIFLERVRRLPPVFPPMPSMSKNHLKWNQNVLGLSLLLPFIIIVSTVWANTQSRFVLMDGSVIQGELLSFSKGVYRINSDALGVISLSEEKIRTIKSVHDFVGSQVENSRQQGGSAGAQKIDQMQDLLLSNPETVRLIDELRDNPSVQQILQDEELMQAIAEGNLNRLSADPKIKALMNDQTIGKIIEKTQ
jgi:hypothetical protein